MKQLISIYALVLLAFVIGVQSKLLYTFTIARHGATYPPNDLYDGNQTKQFRGRLTPIGLRQHYNLDYIVSEKLTTATFNTTHVEVYSTSRQRTINSAQAFLYGFYPLGQGWRIPEQVTADKLNPPYTPLFPEYLTKDDEQLPFALNKGFQPLPVRPLDDILDNCPDYDFLLLKRIQQTYKQISAFQTQQRESINRMRSLFNLSSTQTNIPTMSDLYDTVYADLNLGRPLPTNYSATDHKNLKYMFQFYNTAIFDGNFARVIATPSLRMLRQKLQSVIKKANLKVSFIFGHHSNLLPLLTLFNLTSTDCITQKWKGQPVRSLNCAAPPQYAANLVIELHDDGPQYLVRIKYNGEYMKLCEVSSTQCNYQEFISRVKRIQTNFEQQCKISTQTISSHSYNIVAQ